MFKRTLFIELTQWRSEFTRKPLVLRGARQVGKTTIVHELGKQFKQYIYLNLERQKDAAFFQEEEDIEELVPKLLLEKRMQLNHLSDTLLFIDEIQEIPRVLNQLRYFAEVFPELAVIAAGSMLESLMGKNLIFPVGRVEFMVLRPFSFEEYLTAMDESQLLEAYQTTPIPTYAIPVLKRAFHTYCILGGMPEVIAHYQKHRDFTALKKTYDHLIGSYLHDAEKYARSEQQLHLFRFVIKQSLYLAGERITYQGFGNSNHPSKAVGEALRALEKTHLLHIMHPIVSTKLPLEQDSRKAPRLQFLDTGLMNYYCGIQKDIIGSSDLCTIHQGKMIEHLVGQELLSFQHLSLSSLYFWVRQKKQSDAEVDFVYPYKGKLIPIEVKSGSTGSLRSLHTYMDQTDLHFAIRFYAGSIRIEQVKTLSGKAFHLVSLPYFLAGRIEHYIDWVVSTLPKPLSSDIGFLSEASIAYERRKPEKKWSIAQLHEKHFQLLHACSEGPQNGRTLLEGQGFTYQSRNKREYLKPLIDLGLIDYTNKEYLKSKQQRYQLTTEGQAFLAKVGLHPKDKGKSIIGR
jgi:predicted AAA+ superfamily ATPase